MDGYPYLSCKRGMITIAVLFLLSCAAPKEVEVLDRSSIPEIRTEVPATVSEIREIKSYKMPSESGHQILHLRGQLFTKRIVDGNPQIVPCSKCIVSLRTPGDTANRANMVTEPDGYFQINTQNLPYTFYLNNSGHNRLVIENVSFEVGAISTIKIINATGGTSERFLVGKNGQAYTWIKAQ